MNRSLPLSVDEHTRWDSVTWLHEEQELLVLYTLVGDSAHTLDAKHYIDSLPLEEMACKTLTQFKSHVQQIADCPVVYRAYPTLVYTYGGKEDSSRIGSVTVETFHCLQRESRELDIFNEQFREDVERAYTGSAGTSR